MNGSDVVANAQRAMKNVYILIIVCVACYLLQEMQVRADGTTFLDMFALNREAVVKDHQVWRLLTYAFLHGDFFHILFNMWGLYLFGSMICPAMTPSRIWWLFVVSAVVGGVLQIVTNPEGWCIGASGAVCGFTAAAAMITPNTKIMLIFAPVPISMRSFFWIFIGLSLFMSRVDNGSIAHLAHVGGMFGGYLYIRYLGIGMWDPFGAIFGKSAIRPKVIGVPEARTVRTESLGGDSIDSAEVDRLLEKISKSGVNSLSESEYQLLKRAREQFKRH